MNETEYRQHPGVNFSRLKYMLDSPAHYLAELEKAKRGEGDTHSRGKLRAVHTLVLEPHLFADDYAVWDGGRRGTNAHKAWQKTAGTRTQLTLAEFEAARDIAAAVLANHQALALLSGDDGAVVRFETAGVWTDALTGLVCKGRADILRVYPTHAEVWDLKTSGSNAPRLLSAQCAKLRWHIQAAHYRDMARSLLAKAGHPAGSVPVGGGLIVVEDNATRDVAVWELSPDTIEVGEQQRADLLQQLKDCQESGEWPGRFRERQTLHLPAWAYDDSDDDDGFFNT